MSYLSDEARRTYAGRLSKLVDVIDRTGNTFVFKVKRDLEDIEEKLILAHVSPKIEYLTLDCGYNAGDKNIRCQHIQFKTVNSTYDDEGLLSDSFADECRIIRRLIDYV